MRILFDLVHTSDVNLFKNAIIRLRKDKHDIFITLRERGNLILIAKEELEGFDISSIGKHEKSIFKKIIALIKREFDFYYYIKSNRIQISVNQGLSSVFSCKLLGVPYLQFEDDFEYKLTFYYNKFFATRDIMPDFIPVKGKNVYKYHGFKELAYLHPKVFSPNSEILKKLNILPFQYVFIREVSNISLNYGSMKSYLKEIVEILYSLGLQIVLSLEDKTFSNRFSNKCIILQEPIKDIYSIMINAVFAISSGDTMAREACLLSTPTIYTGGREMVINNPLIEEGIMFKETSIDDIAYRIKFLLDNENALKIRFKAKKTINKEWENTTEVILKHILDFALDEQKFT